jgi:hypothetical protein
LLQDRFYKESNGSNQERPNLISGDHCWPSDSIKISLGTLFEQVIVKLKYSSKSSIYLFGGITINGAKEDINSDILQFNGTKWVNLGQTKTSRAEG